jgi:hypothetical protein
MRYYKGIVRFILREPYSSEDRGTRQTIVGYFRNVVVAANNEARMKEVLRSHGRLDDMESEVDWAGSELQESNYEDLSKDRKLRAREQEQILYCTGRIFFPSDELPPSAKP